MEPHKKPMSNVETFAICAAAIVSAGALSLGIDKALDFCSKKMGAVVETVSQAIPAPRIPQ